jgi:hypothetical protein
LRERNLHHVLREVARRVAHVLPRCGDAAQRRVVVGAEVRSCYAPATGGNEGTQRRGSIRRENRLRRLDHQLELQGARAQLQSPLERAAGLRGGGDVAG